MAKIWCVDFTLPPPPPKWPMLNLKLQAKDYELTLFPPPHNLKSDPFPKQSQDQSLFQAEHFRPKSCIHFFCAEAKKNKTFILGLKLESY